MDIFGNPEDRDIHGNSPRDVFGNPRDTDVFGNPPRDVQGNYDPNPSSPPDAGSGGDADYGDGGGWWDSIGDLFSF